jgi:hypothetical protein
MSPYKYKPDPHWRRTIMSVDAKVDLQTQRVNTQSNIQSVLDDLTC